jgi:drug/metabolite transporter (DMT)-like permease
MPRLQLLAFSSLCLIWGSTWLAIRVVVRDVPPLRAAMVRFLVAAVVLLVWAIFRKGWPKEERQWNAILVLGITIMALPYALLFWAEQYVTSSMSAVLYSALPLVVALLTPLMTHHTVPRQAVFAMLAAFGGLLILLYTGIPTGGRGLWSGIAILVSMSCSAWSVVYAKGRLQSVDPIVATALQLIGGTVALLWATWALEPHRQAHWSRPALLAVIFLGIVGSAAAFAIYYWLLQHMQPYQLSTLNLVVPIIAVIEGALLGRESIPLTMIVAMAVVLASVGVVLRAEASNQKLTLRTDSMMMKDEAHAGEE